MSLKALVYFQCLNLLLPVYRDVRCTSKSVSWMVSRITGQLVCKNTSIWWIILLIRGKSHKLILRLLFVRFYLPAAYRIRRSTYAHAVLGNVIWITVFRCRAILFADDRSVLSEEGSWFCGEDSEQCTSDSWSDIPSAQLLEQISQEVSASKGSTKAEVQLRCVSLLIELLCLFFTVRQCRAF